MSSGWVNRRNRGTIRHLETVHRSDPLALGCTYSAPVLPALHVLPASPVMILRLTRVPFFLIHIFVHSLDRWFVFSPLFFIL